MVKSQQPTFFTAEDTEVRRVLIVVIPAPPQGVLSAYGIHLKAGIHNNNWMPHQVRHDETIPKG